MIFIITELIIELLNDTTFGYSKTERTSTAWYKLPDLGTKDDYQFFMNAGPLSNLDLLWKRR
jgi:hypothetical protein